MTALFTEPAKRLEPVAKSAGHVFSIITHKPPSKRERFIRGMRIGIPAFALGAAFTGFMRDSKKSSN